MNLQGGSSSGLLSGHLTYSGVRHFDNKMNVTLEEVWINRLKREHGTTCNFKYVVSMPLFSSNDRVPQ